jgi:hypothetical protein
MRMFKGSWVAAVLFAAASAAHSQQAPPGGGNPSPGGATPPPSQGAPGANPAAKDPSPGAPASPRVGGGSKTPPPPREGAAGPGRSGADIPKSPQSPSVDAPKADRPQLGGRSGDAPSPKNPNVDPPKSPRVGNPDAATPPRSPRANDAPGRSGTAPGRSVEARKPAVPGADRDPATRRMEGAPRPGRSPDRTLDLDGKAPRPGQTDPSKPPREPGSSNVPGRDGGRPDRTPSNPARDADRPDPKNPLPGERNIPEKKRDPGLNRDSETPRTGTGAAANRRDADDQARGGASDDHPGLTKARTGTERRDGTVKQLRIDPQQLQREPGVQAAVRELQSVRDVAQLDRAFSTLETSTRSSHLAALPIDRVAGRFQAVVQDNRFSPIIQSDLGQRYSLDRQFQLFAVGDIARQLNFNTTLVTNGGWDNRLVGPIYNRYTSSAFSAWYPGPQWYPTYAWTPTWSPWVQWSFWNTVSPIYDPRPFVVRPYTYEVAPIVRTFEYPVWQELPVVAAGTWVDVPEVAVSAGDDLQLLAVRFVDPGHMQENIGPRYRVWFRNNAEADLPEGFDVTLFASEAKELSDQVVQSGVRVPRIAGKDTIAVDVRLPAEANQLVTNDDQDRVPFRYLHAVVDSGNLLKEADEENNGVMLARNDIFQVDPAAFSTNVTVAAPSSVISLAGEGFGPEPGEVIVSVGDRQESAEIRGWYDLGIQITVPNLDVADVQKAEVLVIRGDGAASNPVPLDIASEDAIGVVSQSSTDTDR